MSQRHSRNPQLERRWRNLTTRQRRSGLTSSAPLKLDQQKPPAMVLGAKASHRRQATWIDRIAPS